VQVDAADSQCISLSAEFVEHGGILSGINPTIYFDSREGWRLLKTNATVSQIKENSL